MAWCATNWILLYSVYRNGFVLWLLLLLFFRRLPLLFLLLPLQFLILVLNNIVVHYGLRFWHGCTLLMCSWQQIFYHVAFIVMFLMCDLIYYKKIELRFICNLNVCCFPRRWVDVSIYWNIICCFFALRLPSNWVVQMEYTMDWDTSTVHTVYSISPYLCVLLRACLGILFSIPRLLSVFVQ